jgi:hypothetical protein
LGEGSFRKEGGRVKEGNRDIEKRDIEKRDIKRRGEERHIERRHIERRHIGNRHIERRKWGNLQGASQSVLADRPGANRSGVS